MKGVGLVKKPEVERREGSGGPASLPEILNPFTTYRLVLAGDECRFFQMRVPSKWYWKLYVTAANEDKGMESKLTAAFETSEEGWKPLVPLETHKEFPVADASSQAALGVANDGDDRMLTLKLCQNGSPVIVTLESQVSAYGHALLQPPLNKTLPERPEDSSSDQ
jgi:hypothetical protein